MMLTTAEAAALLDERGIRTATGKPYTAKVIQQYCARGVFAGAIAPTNERRGYWQIPRAAVEQFQPKRGRPPAVPPISNERQGEDDDEANTDTL